MRKTIIIGAAAIGALVLFVTSQTSQRKSETTGTVDWRKEFVERQRLTNQGYGRGDSSKGDPRIDNLNK
jgi:hypothetical protein